jgi:tight adherence protein B
MTLAIAAAGLGLTALAAVRRAVRAGRRYRAYRRLQRSPAFFSADRLPPAPSWLRIRLADAAVSVDAGAVAIAWSGVVILAPLAALVLGGPGLAVAAAGAGAVAPWIALQLAAGRRTALIEAGLPVALEAMARTLRTGGSLRQAVSETAGAVAPPLRDDLAVVAAQVERGAPLSAALDAWAGRCPVAGVRLAVAALALGADTGGAQARAIDGVAATIRDRLGAAAEVKAQATQARVSGVVIALSPIGFCALASSTDARTAAFLFRTTPGLVLLTAGLGLDALGAVWMSRITAVSA